MSDALTVASEPTTTSPSLDSLDSSQYDHWRTTGTLPSSEESTSTPKAESSPAQPVEQADRIGVVDPPASEPGTPSKPNAETRKPELESDIRDLLAERARIKADIEALRSSKPTVDATPPASSPGTARPLIEAIKSPDIDRPPLSDAEFFAQYPDATLVDLNRYAARYEILSDRRHAEVTQTVQGRTSGYTAKMADALKADPQLWTSLDPRLNAAPVDVLPAGVTPTAANALAQEILTCDDPAAVLKHLTAHPEALTRLLAAPNGLAIARGLGRIEASLSSTAQQPAPAGDPVSLAPKPTPSLGKKPAQPADELADAIRTGDFAKYSELTNRKELSKTG